MAHDVGIAATVRATDSQNSVPQRVVRFTRTERTVHWVQASSFLLLLITGFALSLPWVEAIVGHRALLREIHLAGAFFFAFGPTIVALGGDRRSMGQDVESVDTWDSDDLRWLIPFPLLRLLGVSTPPQGRFNAGQKLNAIFVVWSTVIFTGTGVILWQNRRFSIDLVQRANTVHTALAYVALVAFLGHLFLATTYPKTRHAFRAITQGWVNRDWSEQHHPKWVRSVTPSAPPPPHDALRTVVQIVLGSAVALFAVRFYFFWLGANTTDKVTDWLYTVTAWPGLASIRPQTGVQVADWPALIYLLGCLSAWLAVDRMRRMRTD